ncbi:HlyC/CorC family transporter [Haloterrigena salifodinae]|uniref:HlyC/CorC family transporter n=1 Tax=Haloterrigena salifodinae TaxID=2675099 RepID=A0A8T8DYS8_9EURY|nr:hemolysin family protein [Haloterrigena salifodinae]QRV14738.1 HlyC/CorC family transporter [Haloterrigena salifodinae]
MNPVMIVARLAAGLAFILANAFFVAIEFGLTRARQYSAEEFDEPGLQRAWEMTDDLEVYLTSCQVGITASSIAVGIVAEPALAALFEPFLADTGLASLGAGGILAFVIINLVHLTHGEQTPTYLGVERSKTVCRYCATPLYWFAWLISPIIRIGDGVAKWTLGLFGVEMSGAWLETEVDTIESRAELRTELASVLEEGDLPDERREEVLNALEIGTESVEEVAVPSDDVVALSTAVEPEENLRRIEESPHTRYPLVGDDLSDYRGNVYVPMLPHRGEDLVDDDSDVDIESIASKPLEIDPDTSVSDAIDRFQAANGELALVTDDDGVVGLLTVTDAVEEIMGELRDPMDVRADTEAGAEA